MESINIQNEVSTLQNIINSNSSLCRFGDGELRLCLNNGKSIACQSKNNKLSKRLNQILTSNIDNLLIGIPNIRPNSKIYKQKPELHNVFLKDTFEKLYDKNKLYYSSFITRDDIISQNYEYWKLFQKIYQNKKLVLVSGIARAKNSTFFSNAKSINIILTPKQNAFKKYDHTLKECQTYDTTHTFVLMVGPTATVLAYDLHNLGYQALDIGHAFKFYENIEKENINII